MFLKTFINSFKHTNLNTGVMEYYDGDVSSLPDASAGRAIWLNNGAVSYDDRNNSGWYLRVGSSGADGTYASGSLVDTITTLTEISKSIVSNSGNIMKSLTVTLQNNTGSTVTIREIGLGTNVLVGSSTLHSMTSILARKVLTNPITMNDGDIYSFTYQLALSMED